MGARSGGGGGGRSGGGGGAATATTSLKEINKLKAPTTGMTKVQLKSDGTMGYAYQRKTAKQGQFVYGTMDSKGNIQSQHISAWQPGAYGYTSVASTKSEAWGQVKTMFGVYAGLRKY